MVLVVMVVLVQPSEQQTDVSKGLETDCDVVERGMWKESGNLKWKRRQQPSRQADK